MSIQSALDFLAACRDGRVDLAGVDADGGPPRQAILRRAAESGFDFDSQELDRALRLDAHARLVRNAGPIS